MKFTTGLVIAAGLLFASPAFADGHANWKSVDDQSRVAFGSVKKDVVGEVHHFNKVSGTVSESGELSISIDLGSVNTNIDIRNERMTEHVFQAGKATATVTGSIDMEEVEGLKAGETAVLEVEAELAFGGVETEVEAEMLVARLSESRVLVSTADFIMISTEDLGIDAGIDQLMKLAKLPDITRVTPVSIRMVFEK